MGPKHLHFDFAGITDGIFSVWDTPVSIAYKIQPDAELVKNIYQLNIFKTQHEKYLSMNRITVHKDATKK